MSIYGNQDKEWVWKESGEDWSNFGLACLLCGERFFGGIDKAMRPLLAHSAVEHQGKAVRYAAFATPLSALAKDQARKRIGLREAVQLERILDEHGSGWYFYALHYGSAEALDHIQRAQEVEATETLRERVQRRTHGG